MKGLAPVFFGYLPRIFAAMLILLAGFLFGNFPARAAVLAAVNAGISGPHFVGSAVRALIGILTFAMALNQLQIASNIITAVFTIMFGALMLGMALAIGLGGRDAPRQKHICGICPHMLTARYYACNRYRPLRYSEFSASNIPDCYIRPWHFVCCGVT
jgi:hypothetical protein